jgi:hypothetical protein
MNNNLFQEDNLMVDVSNPYGILNIYLKVKDVPPDKIIVKKIGDINEYFNTSTNKIDITGT